MNMSKDFLVMTIVNRTMEQMSVKDMMAYVEDALYNSFKYWKDEDLVDYIATEWPEEG